MDANLLCIKSILHYGGILDYCTKGVVRRWMSWTCWVSHRVLLSKQENSVMSSLYDILQLFV